MADTSRTDASRKGSFACSACGHGSPRWFGKCPECGSWNSAVAPVAAGDEAAAVISLGDCGPAPERMTSGLEEVDRVLGGGLVLGEVVLLGGDPGVGKSTLVLQFLNGLLERGLRSLLVTGEESIHQVGMRAARLGVNADALRIATTQSLRATLAACAQEQPDVLVVDSIQTMMDPELEQAAGSIVQVRECATSLVRHAKTSGTAVILIGHVTKDGSIAGPKALEHVVDAVLSMEGERSGSMRLLRSTKNRFGSCDELGIFAMSTSGLQTVEDPSAMLLADRHAGVSGSVVFPTLDGIRPMLVEVQALVTRSDVSQARRVAVGVESRRLALACAVLGEKAGVSFEQKDVFVSAAGGFAIKEPAADLALCLALASASRDVVVDPRTVPIGEVGLSGEIRRVPGLERRLEEARRLGFKRAILPQGARANYPGIDVTFASDLSEAVRLIATPTAS